MPIASCTAALLCTAEFGSGNVTDNHKHFQSGAFGGGLIQIAGHWRLALLAVPIADQNQNQRFSSICNCVCGRSVQMMKSDEIMGLQGGYLN